MIRVLIVDDHAVVRQGLALLLQAESGIEVIGEAPDGATAVMLARSLTPHVILLDLMMPDMDGVTTLKKLREAGVAAKVLVLTSSVEDELIRKALAAGADGYLLKASRMSEVVSAITQVAGGGSVLDPVVAQKVMAQMRAGDPLDALTGREREVFKALARGYNYEEIAGQIGVSEATVRTHGASLLDKLGLRDRAQVMTYALKRGLVHPDDLL
jgi:DNA-binding NarL/FixJ family response regulator